MRCPHFVPYLGRKSCPLGLPLAPRIDSAPDAATALRERHRTGHEAGWRSVMADPVATPTIAMDAGDIADDDPRLRRMEFRRDQPRSRRRWQFDLREEAVLGIGDAP